MNYSAIKPYDVANGPDALTIVRTASIRKPGTFITANLLPAK